MALQSYLVSALRHIGRNRVHSVINVAGLALGIAAAVVVMLYVRNELTFERFIPQYAHIYRVSSTLTAPGEAAMHIDTTAPGAARWLATRASPNIVARITGGADHDARIASVDLRVTVSWADPGFFDIFQLRVVAGDPRHALNDPDSAVLTRSEARRLFHRDDPVGSTLILDHAHPLRIAAVIEDLPPSTHLQLSMIGSTLAAFAPVRSLEVAPTDPGEEWRTHTYVRVQTPQLLQQVRQELEAFVVDQEHKAKPGAMHLNLVLEPISRIHMLPPGGAAMKSRGNLTVTYAIAVVGALILVVAAINFVNLTTARASKRNIEVGVRKTFGARRRDILIQFLGEALLYSLVATLLALALVELLIPAFNRLAHASLAVNYLRDPSLLAMTLGLGCLAGVIAGLYPALLHASRRAAGSLQAGMPLGRGTPRLVLVMTQFAVLIGLLTAIGIIAQQTRYARDVVARMDATDVYAVEGGCKGHAADVFRRLPGVVAAACSGSAPLGYTEIRAYGAVRPGIRTFFDKETVDFGFFELYRIRPLAGRLFQAQRGTDSASGGDATGAAEAVIINETAVRKFGFTSLSAAIGQSVDVTGNNRPSQIIGVVPDLPFRSVRTPIEATVFHIAPAGQELLSVKLDPARKAQALAALDALWAHLHGAVAMKRYPMEQAMSEIYADIVTDGVVFASCSLIALVLGCLGIFGLSSFIAERRTREMGIRKALGATRFDIVQMMVWESSRPVLWANLIAWPICYVVMRQWLQTFAYHVDLSLGAFAAASIVALLLSCMTVMGHVLSVARAKPVVALRHE